MKFALLLIFYLTIWTFRTFISTTQCKNNEIIVFRYNIDFGKLEAQYAKDIQLMHFEEIDIQNMYQCLDPYFQEEKYFFAQIS